MTEFVQKAVIIDGNLPDTMQRKIATRLDLTVGEYVERVIFRPRVLSGTLGAKAITNGDANLAFYSNFVADRSVLLKNNNYQGDRYVISATQLLGQ